MAKKRFDTGDRVRHVMGGPVMQVCYYEFQKIPFLNIFHGEPRVACAWKDGRSWRKQVFEQDALIKLGTQNSTKPAQRTEVVPGIECREIN